MEGDVFTNSKSKSKFLKKSSGTNNFFIQPEQVLVSSSLTEPLRHLNDYDSNILQEDAYKEVDDNSLKLEYKINKLENEIKDLNSQIEAADSIHSYEVADSLTLRKTQLELDLAGLKELYKESGFSAKISGGITGKFKDKFDIINKLLANINNYVLSLLPGKVSSFIMLKSSLSKLENINKSVDELMSLKIPYGESIEKYEQLSKYIIKANAIQADISKVWKK